MCFYKPIPKSMVMYGKIVNIKRRRKKKGRDNHTLKNIYTVF